MVRTTTPTEMVPPTTTQVPAAPTLLPTAAFTRSKGLGLLAMDSGLLMQGVRHSLGMVGDELECWRVGCYWAEVISPNDMK